LSSSLLKVILSLLRWPLTTKPNGLSGNSAVTSTFATGTLLEPSAKDDAKKKMKKQKDVKIMLFD